MNFRNLVPEVLKTYFRKLRYEYYSFKAGRPERHLKFIGVTGSSGKSTTASMIFHVLHENNIKVGVISTLGARAGEKIMETGLHVTSPDPKELQESLAYMVEKGIEYVVLESSSHAMAQGRFGNIHFDHAIFTNITSDHLDWHGSWEKYAHAKAMLMNNIPSKGSVVINRGDKKSYDFLNNYAKDHGKENQVITYAASEVTETKETEEGIDFSYEGTEFFLPMLGTYNIDNALATIAVSKKLGLSYKKITKALKTFPGLDGRMEIMQKNPFLVIVNFAHNTDSLEKALKSVRNYIAGNNKVIAVFGSAGRRDVLKRTTMGEVSAELADYTVITSEDPRDESLFEINSTIIEGAETKDAQLVKRFKNTKEYKAFKIDHRTLRKGSVFAFDEENVNSRYDAIDFAINKLAKPGDVVITEGKGHEKSLCFGTTEFPFSDQDAVKRALSKS